MPTCTVPPGTMLTVGLSDWFGTPNYGSPFFLCTGSSQGLYVPAPKRPRYFEVDIDKDKDQPCPSLISDDEDSEEEFDPESYYATDSGEETPKEVKKFLESTFRRCLPRKRRKTIAREYPKPNLEVTKVPKADRDISNILDQAFPTKSDKQLSQIQAAVLACLPPLLVCGLRWLGVGSLVSRTSLYPPKRC